VLSGGDSDPAWTGLATVQVTGSFADSDGEPLRGSVTLYFTAPVSDAVGHVIVDDPRAFWLSGGSLATTPWPPLTARG